jgi:hypothetical protein
MKQTLVFLSAILLISTALFCSSNYKFEKNLTLDRNESYSNNIISFGGNIDIKGNVKHSLILIGGSLKLDGEIGEDIICIGAHVEISENALVKGDVFAIGGKLSKAPGAKLMGDFTNFRFDLKKIESTLIPILSDVRIFTFFKIIKIILWFVITLIVFAVFPRKINRAENLFANYILKIGAVGLISLFSFFFLLFVFIIMSFILIGIPLLFALLLCYFFTFILGRTILFYYIGDKIAAGLRLKNITPSLFVLFGVIFYGILNFIPLVGPIILLILNIFEVGIGVGFIARKRLNLIDNG